MMWMKEAAALEETSAALQEISSKVRQTAEAAVHAQATVSSARTDAQEGGDVVGSLQAGQGLGQGPERGVGVWLRQGFDALLHGRVM